MILAAASFEKEKYYLEKEFEALPEGIKEELRNVCIILADKLMCTFVIGFHPDGEVYFETIMTEGLSDFDDIGAELEIKILQKEKAELLKALKLWYLVYYTPEGERIKEELLKNRK